MAIVSLRPNSKLLSNNLKMIRVDKVGGESIAVINTLANAIWPSTYKNIISDEQISYMLEMIYSIESLNDQILNKKHQFIIAYEDNIPVGYSSYSIKNDSKTTYRVHKLYVSVDHQGKGVGKLLLHTIITDIQPQAATALQLNVNRLNPSVDFYKKNGFYVLEEEMLDIGNGFFMDDYIMQKLV
jgi:ribosomal protein S18 acetylase RimI-like enzyme